MRTYLSLALPLILLTTNALADQPFVDTRDIEHCLAANPSQADCIGTASENCIEAAGGSGAVLGACFGQELDFWDDLLNATYGDALVEARSFDVLATEHGSVPPIAAHELRDMQRAWIPYRDARCAVIRFSYYGGTGAASGGTECRMRATAEQTLVLRAIWARFYNARTR